MNAVWIKVLWSVMFVAASAVVCSADLNSTLNSNWLLAKYDQNGDAAISAAEITEKKHKVFQFMDADNDGIVDMQEYLQSDAARRKAVLKARFDKLDSDHDGLISDSEYSHYMGSFASIDFDGDGNLSAEEVSAMQSRHSQAVINAEAKCFWLICLRAGN